MQKARNYLKFCLLMVATAILCSAGGASAVEKPRSGEDILRETYRRNIVRLESNSFGLPLVLNSYELDDRVHVNAYGIFTYPISSVASVLQVPANLCDIVSLHPNVKACTYMELHGAWLLTFYFGRKVYQPPEDARPIIYRYTKVAQQQGYMDIVLSADLGPFGTKDHKMRFEALPVDGGRTFINVSYEYKDSAALRLAEKAYFATLGRGKVGFTVTATDKNGGPIYIGGPRGAIERNAVRYYLAIQSFLDALRYPERTRFAKSILEWYDLTTRYKRQLVDLERKDYIAFKTLEHNNQMTLQRRIETALP